jgi:hypothetical protein
MERSNLDRFTTGLQQWFRGLGFTMEFEGIFTTLESVEFCQARPVKLETGWTLVPRPGKRLYSDLVSTKDLSSRKVYDAWLGSVAGCGMAASAGVPLFDSFYKWLARGSKPYIPKLGEVMYRQHRTELSEGMEMKSRDPSWEARISFYFAFDITPQAQLLIERHFDSLPDPVHGEFIDDPVQVIDSILQLCPPEQGERYDLGHT